MALIPTRAGLVAGGVLAVVAAGSAVFVSQQERFGAPQPPAAVAQGPTGGAPPGQASATTARPAAPSFDVVRVAPSGNAVVAGRAEPLALVTVQSNGQELGQVRADGRGEWVFLPPGPLPEGAQQLSLVARSPAGNETRSATQLVLLVPDRPAPQAATAFAVSPPPAGDAVAEPQPVVAVLAPPSGPVRVLQGPRTPSAHVTLDVVDYDSTGQIRFAGAGPAGTPVRVYVDNATVGDARTDRDGHWTLEPGASVKPGVHALRVDQLGGRGQVLSRVEMPFQRAELPSLEPGRVVVQPGQNLWRIARQAYGSGVRYTVIYRANQDQIRDPDRIYPGQAFNVPSPPPAKPGGL